MDNQRGFALYASLAALLAFGLLLAYAGWQKSRYEAVSKEYGAFKAQVEAVGRAAEAEAKRINAENKAKTERINRENSRLRSDNARLSDELFNARSRSGALSGVSSPANRPDLACFSRADYERAFRQFDQELSGIAQECDARTIDLNSGRDWVHQVQH